MPPPRRCAPIEPGGPPWYHTGDLGALDDEGYLSIVGRARDILRTGGETVAPAEVEAVLVTHPDVAEVAVVGLPDTEWGEVITAVVVPRAGHRYRASNSCRRTATTASRRSSSLVASRRSTHCRGPRQPARCSGRCSSSG